MPASQDGLFIINDSTNNDILHPKGMGKGYDPDSVPKDLPKPPSLFGDAPGQIKEFSDAEILARVQELWERKATLWHLRQTAANGEQMPTLDQNGQGYCWAYSTTRAIMYIRALQNQPYRRLSGHAIGCMVKNFRDEGAWAGLSWKFAAERGVPSVEFWKEKSMNPSNNNAATWENAAANKIAEGFFDPTIPVYDQNMTKRQRRTLLCLNIPIPSDRNRWSHSTLDHTLVIVDGEVCEMGDNSWTDEWGNKGTYVFQGDNMQRVDGCVAVRAIPAGIN